MGGQRQCRRLAGNGKAAGSLVTRSSSEPRTPAGKARVLDARKWLRERDRLSAGGRWIRTIGTPREKPASSPVGTRSPEPPRGGGGLSASAIAPSGNRPIFGSALSRVRVPSRRVTKVLRPPPVVRVTLTT